jgi:gamma-glutamyltranspeptidase / glutathione hydrolase
MNTSCKPSAVITLISACSTACTVKWASKWSNKWLRLALMTLVMFQASLVFGQVSDQVEPEQASDVQPNTTKVFASKNEMVVTANPLATEAGLEVLAKGGNAIDAMVAIQTVLGLVEPQSSGLGGGAFAVYYDAKTNSMLTFDGRETAPLQAKNDLFLNADETPMKFFDAVVGGRSVGTPGTVALLGEMHSRFGNLAWAALFDQATTLAELGFKVSPRLAQAIEKDQARLSVHPATRDYFLPDGTPLQINQPLKNPDYAASLKYLAKHGAHAFYSEEFALPIVETVRNAANSGVLSLDDFKAYKVVERQPSCFDYRVYRVCGMGPPSSGAIAVNQVLGVLAHTNFAALKPESAQAWHLISEATRLAFADRNRYVADSDFVDLPPWLLDKNYLKQRSKDMSLTTPSEKVEAGLYPQNTQAVFEHYVSGVDLSQPSTTHFVVADRQGNVLSMTSTVENGFGSRLMARGFLLNNELTDFSFSYRDEQGLIANRIAPGKRPRSSMAPTIVLRDGAPFLALGSPGGSRIITYVTNTLIRILDWKYSPHAAVNAAHISNRFGTMDMETGFADSKLAEAFVSKGYSVTERDLNSGLHVIQFENNALLGAADPRREGSVGGR